MHSSGQSIGELERTLNFKGEILSILDTMNAITVRMPADEAERFRQRPDVLSVESAELYFVDGSQSYPGWGLDRIDEQYPNSMDNTFNYTATGAGRMIYILDSGMDIGTPVVNAEFGSRATMFYDWSGGSGEDCHSHGTIVASIAASNTYGVAKGATVRIVKVTTGCTKPGAVSTWVQDSFNWLANNAPAGTIVNASFGPENCAPTGSATATAITNAFNAGILIFTSAGNDNCDIGSSVNWKNLSEVFVVGGLALYFAEDRKWIGSNWGANISTWAPAEGVLGLVDNQYVCNNPPNCWLDGTSFASPFVAGMAAAACESAGGACDINQTANLYSWFRMMGSTGTVKNEIGGALVGSPSRVIWHQW